MAELAERVGTRMRERREELGLTQAEVANRIEGKTTSDQVSRWERGKHQPNDLGPIAQALDVDISYFYAPAPEKSETPDPFPANGHVTLDAVEGDMATRLDGMTQLLRELVASVVADQEARREGPDVALAQALARFTAAIEKQNQALDTQTEILKRIEAAIDRSDTAAKEREDETIRRLPDEVVAAIREYAADPAPQEEEREQPAK